MDSTVRKAIFAGLPMAICSCICLFVSVVSFWGAYFIGTTWLYAPLPKEQVLKVYITSQATVRPLSVFKPGLPQGIVSVDEFQRISAGKPYFVSYPAEWETGRPSNYGFITYMMRTSTDTMEMYVAAFQEIPNYNDERYEALGYMQRTSFNPLRKEFFSEVTGVHYGRAIGAMAIVAFSLFFMAITFGAARLAWKDAAREM